jgi:hypothetical protein
LFLREAERRRILWFERENNHILNDAMDISHSKG